MVTETQALLATIINDFLQPTMDRLSNQLQRHINLTISMKMASVSAEGKVSAGAADLFPIESFARISASDTAIAGRYKYELQCVFPDDGLDGFSGVHLKGAVYLTLTGAENNYSGFTYTYNDWAWKSTLRDF